MKLYRSEGFDCSKSSIWKNEIFRFRHSSGKIFVAKALLLGFDTNNKIFKLGPFILRPYIKTQDKILGTWPSEVCVMELRFQDQKVEPPRETPVSAYVEPYWLIHAFYQALQLYVDAWVGMGMIYYFDEAGKKVDEFGSYLTKLADTWHSTPKTHLLAIKVKEVQNLIRAQKGKCSLSIDRYGKGLSGIMEDSILDFVIVLESLLGYKLQNEISHRFSLRGALLLSKKKSERAHYYNALKYFYDLRSKIVHGETDEIFAPQGAELKYSLGILGIDLQCSSFELRYHIAELARKLARRALIYFIQNERHLDFEWLKKLELDINS